MFSVYRIFCICAAVTILHIPKIKRKKRTGASALTVALVLEDYTVLRDKIAGQMCDSEVNLSEWMEFLEMARWVDRNLKTCAPKVSLPSLEKMVEKIMTRKAIHQARQAP